MPPNWSSSIFHISGIPNHGCPMDRLVVFSASEKCSESERRAVNGARSASDFLHLVNDTYIADTPGHGTFFARGRCLIRLTLDALSRLTSAFFLHARARRLLTQIHNVISADGAVVNDYIPCPKSYCVPLPTVSGCYTTVRISGPTFLTSNLFLPSVPASAPTFAAFPSGAFPFPEVDGPASGMSTSAIL